MANPIVFTPALKGESPNELFLESLFYRHFKASVIQPRRCTFPDFPSNENAWCPATFVSANEFYDEAKVLYETLESSSLEARCILVFADYICRLALLVSDKSIRSCALKFVRLLGELRRGELLGVFNGNDQMKDYLRRLESDMAWRAGVLIKDRLPLGLDKDDALTKAINEAATKIESALNNITRLFSISL